MFHIGSYRFFEVQEFIYVDTILIMSLKSQLNYFNMIIDFNHLNRSRISKISDAQNF